VRKLLLAFVLSLTAWAALAHTTPRSGCAVRPAIGVADLASPATADASGRPDDPTRWNARRSGGASIPESRWRSPLIHAELAGICCGEVFTNPQRVDGRDRPARDGLSLLRDIPLLI
jgi:hypothetical protein